MRARSPQRLKPRTFFGPGGTTEVVPFPISLASGFFVVQTLLLFVDLALFHYELNCFECANVG